MAAKSPSCFPLFPSLLLILLSFASFGSQTFSVHGLYIREATISDLQQAFKQNQLTSRKLVEFYLQEIRRLNPVLNAVIEVNPDTKLIRRTISERQRVLVAILGYMAFLFCSRTTLEPKISLTPLLARWLCLAQSCLVMPAW